jgi:putative transposase
VKYHAIQTTVSSLSTRRCTLLGARSGYYSWTTRPSLRARQNGRLVAMMRRIHAEADRTYGSPRCAELTARGLRAGGIRSAADGDFGIRAKQRHRYRGTTDGVCPADCPNRLQQQFTASAPNQVWMADLTYVRTQEGWSYLAVILDAFARRVVAGRWARLPPTSTASARHGAAARQPGRGSSTTPIGACNTRVTSIKPCWRRMRSRRA